MTMLAILPKQKELYGFYPYRAMMYRERNQLFTAFLLILIGIVGRIYLRNFLPAMPHFYITINGITQPIFIADMFFLIAIIALFSGILLRGIYSFIVPLVVMAITDLLYGNNFIFLFTWSGFAFISLLGYRWKNKLAFNAKSVAMTVGLSASAVIIYDLWTNFGWWLGPYYPHNLQGLALCYTLALPFFIWHLLSTAVATTIVAFPLLYLKEQALSVKTVKSIENYVPAIASLFLAIISFLSIL